MKVLSATDTPSPALGLTSTRHVPSHRLHQARLVNASVFCASSVYADPTSFTDKLRSR